MGAGVTVLRVWSWSLHCCSSLGLQWTCMYIACAVAHAMQSKESASAVWVSRLPCLAFPGHTAAGCCFLGGLLVLIDNLPLCWLDTNLLCGIDEGITTQSLPSNNSFIEHWAHKLSQPNWAASCARIRPSINSM